MEYSTKFQINGACYQITKYFQSFELLTTLLQFLFWNSNLCPKRSSDRVLATQILTFMK